MEGLGARLALGLVSVLLCAGILELVARQLGHGPWRPAAPDVRVVPGGSLFEPHPELGYRHRPGRYRVAQGELRFVVTHGDDSLRTTGPPGAHERPEDGEIWIFGGSFTHGWGVNDRQTFPWLLQERMPRLHVVNFGVSGYGTLHALIQLEAALARRGPPNLAVIAYASFHDLRNVFARERRKVLVPYNRLGLIRQPLARLDAEDELQVEMSSATYAEVPLMRYSAAAHMVEKALNRAERSSLRETEVTLEIIERFAAIAGREGFAFVIAGISPSLETRQISRFAAREDGGRSTSRTISSTADTTIFPGTSIPINRVTSSMPTSSRRT